MEKIFQYLWQHRLYGAHGLATNDGRQIRVIDPGLLNSDAGPDFFNAKIEIDGRLWVGNVEIHVRASDWLRHKHHLDKAYDSVILHVVNKDDGPVFRTNGELIPQTVIECAPQFTEQLNHLLTSDANLPCAQFIPSLPKIAVTEMIERLAFERLHSKVERIKALHETYSGSWEDVCYVSLARNLGFGINNDAFERMARRTPLRMLHKHSDSLLQIEALLFGQAGLLNPLDHPDDDYYQRLVKEYTFLANKFSLSPIDATSWKLFRIRPQNFPHRRIAMLAHYVHNGFELMTHILEAENYEQMRDLFNVRLSGYWANHYSFGNGTENSSPALGRNSIDIILINTVAVLLYAHDEITGGCELGDRAVSLLEQIKPENNSIVATFTRAGIECRNALASQALIQLRRQYCEAKKCLYCKIGHRLLRSTTV